MNNFVNTGTRPVSGKTRKGKVRTKNNQNLQAVPNWQERPTPELMKKVIELGTHLYTNGLQKSIPKHTAIKVIEFILERSHNPSTSLDIMRYKTQEMGIKFSDPQEKSNYFILVEKIWERSQHMSQRKDYSIINMHKLLEKL